MEQVVVLGLTASGTELVAFDDRPSRTVRSIGTVTGLRGDTRLVGIDFGRQDGLLHGRGDAGGRYVLCERSAAATPVDVPVAGEEGARAADHGYRLRVDVLGAVADGLETVRREVTDIAVAVR